jgi:hypothetical protein
MKAIIKATGEIATVECRWVTTIGGNDVLRFIDQKTGISYTEHQLAFLFQEDNKREPDYWEKLEHQAAISIYCNYLNSHNWTWSYEDIIFKAHALVEKMKEERK